MLLAVWPSVCDASACRQARWERKRGLLRLWTAIGQTDRAERVKSPWHDMAAGTRSKAQAVAALVYHVKLSRAVGREVFAISGKAVGTFL